MSIKVRRSDGVVIGQVDGGVFRKRVRSSQHFLRTPPAIAFDRVSLSIAERAGAVALEVTDLDTGSVYSCSVASFRAGCINIDRGYGEQLALPLHRWSVRSSSQPRLL